MPEKKAVLVLENGVHFTGISIGHEGEAKGEIVFNTSLTGYQEILTDPSYKGQIVTLTYPLIGNYGCSAEDAESSRPWAEGLVIKEMAPQHSSWRATESLDAYMKKHKIVGIQGIDTRKLTKIIRSQGAQRAIVSSVSIRVPALLERIRQIPPIVGTDLVKEVTTAEPYQWNESLYVWPRGYGIEKKFEYRIVAYDFGIKKNILRNLAARSSEVLVVPAKTPWKEVLHREPDGVLLSNGPGDPEPLDYAVENTKHLIGKVPLFGICLGHQILALALGAKTYKLKFGHHGANHPVKNLETGAIEITSQNHGFAVEIKSLEGKAKLTHINLNDQTAEGLALRNKHLFSVQYHPESSPGPHDSGYLFSGFLQMIKDFKERTNAKA